MMFWPSISPRSPKPLRKASNILVSGPRRRREDADPLPGCCAAPSVGPATRAAPSATAIKHEAHRIRSACRWIWPRDQDSARGTVSQPSFPENARWNAERQAVEFGVEIGEYHGVVRVARRVFQRLLCERPAPSGASRPFYLQRTRFESMAQRKIRGRQLTQDGNVEIRGRDLR